MIQEKIANLKSQIADGLIVSCQAPENSPLAKPEIIAALAKTAELNGASGVRIDSPENIRAVKAEVKIPVIGIYKLVSDTSEVYITPTVEAARAVAAAGADMIAFDATLRPRPAGTKIEELAEFIRHELQLPVMADVATLTEGRYACEVLGSDFVGTTLSGYTAETAHLLAAPDFALVESLAAKIKAPIICEGRLTSPSDVRRAFDCGAFAVVVGKAITGIDQLVHDFADVCRKGQNR